MGFRTWWRNRQRSKHMLDGPGMVNVPAPICNGEERQCTSCGQRIAPQHQHLVLCPKCGARLPQLNKE